MTPKSPQVYTISSGESFVEKVTRERREDSRIVVRVGADEHNVHVHQIESGLRLGRGGECEGES